MKKFRFQQFEIQQSKKIFRVGTDAVLLGTLANIEHSENILEVGTGTGIISLMLAQRNPKAHFLGLDIDENAVEFTRINFKNSPFSDRMRVILQDFKHFHTDCQYDLIISNPPYFEKNVSDKDVVARQRLTLDFESLVQKSVGLLTENGRLCIIIPFEFSNEVEKFAQKENLFLKTKINIYGIQGGKQRRVILTFSKQAQKVLERDFVIEKSPRNYSDEYLAITKDFHIFG
ncbi:MAG: tRNA (adenine-N(6)-)-methyltransferase [Flavobacteriales bacterium]|nr:MAG: tRNA (adenine-N(6)-)-methyltransferase [Flavobacteriales bacterium]